MTALDYTIFSAYLLLSVWLGGFIGRGQSSLREYLLAGADMNRWIVGLSVLAALFSGISYLAGPGEVYANGFGFAYVLLAFFIATPITAQLLMPHFYQSRFFTAYQVLEERFSLPVRLLASGLFIFRVILWLAAATYAPALALEQTTGLPLWFTIIATGVLTTIYTTMGGMKAVIWTDIMQLAVLFGGQMLIAIMAASKVPGGFAGVLEGAVAAGKFDLSLNFSLTERVTLLGIVIGGTFMNLVQMATDQVSVQRYLTAGSLREAQRGLWIKLWFIIPVLIVFYGTGLVLAAFYETQGDPVKAGLIAKADQILPYFVVHELPHGLPGLLIAAIFAASMSTISSGLNSLTSATLVDFEGRLTKQPQRSDAQQVSRARWVTAAYGVLVTGMAFLISLMKGNLVESVNTIIGLVGGPMLGLFTLAFFTQSTRPVPAMIGALAGFMVALLTQTGALGVKVSFLWYAFIGWAVSTGLGWGLSLALPSDKAGLGKDRVSD
jgi:SSS family transporter